MINRFLNFYEKRYSLPKEAKPAIARRNVNIVTVVFVLLLILSLSELIPIFIRGSKIDVYYLILGIISAFVILMRKVLLKINKYMVSQTFIILIVNGIYALITYGSLNTPNIMAALISLYIAAVLLVISLDVTPIAHFCYTTAIAAFIYCNATKHDLTFAFLGNNQIFCIGVFLLSLYKRKSVKKREEQRLQIEKLNKQLEDNNIELGHQKDSLLVNKQYLENFVHSQSEELQEQNERIIRIQDNTIVSLSNLVENRDEDTGNHVVRTRAYVELIAKKAQLSGNFPELNDETIRLYAKAAPMHDIGKIVVPDEILKKPGKLTPEEFEIIKLHTIKGGEIVENVLGAAEDDDYVRIAKEIATTHHEKYDGSGYPKGLSGTDIPLSGRIMAIADVFDALVSPRCYKSPMPEEEAFKIISESAGKHFDPQLAQIFIDSKEEVIEIHKNYL